ncbi:catalase [Paucibacter sp. APW11]|uniref:Catalase n=1 Tax=Roseateles aquae TaxID=3077235 RepID=A0ABU3PB63_9BURK|nr:catalase [Paucibacter sp. APW11]MDT8999480.1 catalase [Paucibacter sp. APW11]
MKSTPKTRASAKSVATPQDTPLQVAEQMPEQMPEQMAELMAAAMPENLGKAKEFGRANALAPARGASMASIPAAALASTLSEGNASAKTAALDPTRSNAGQALSSNQGVLIGDNQNSLKVGLRGPTLLEDFLLREKITHFDHERIPERIVHARGSAAHGYFVAYAALTALTRAAPFQAAGKITPVFVRFSTVAGERGSSDTARDIRGFAVKFYTDEGNWDLVGNNIPVFFIQDAMKFPDLIHAVKPEPHHGMPQAASAHDTFWDFVSLMPESTHALMWVMSDRGIPRSLRMMQGFGVHTYRLVNADGESQFVKFHWKPKLGTHSLVWDEAVKISGADPDFHRRDLWEAIESGDYPEWELGLQIFSEAQADSFSFDVLDASKLIPEELVPVTPVGRMVLNRNPDNFFAETEQVAFCAAHVVPGIDFSNDPLLAGRIHSYLDTQITRLGGANFHELPINAPLAPVHNNQRDGLHRQTIPRGRVAYEPNSLGGGCPFQAGAAGFVSFPQALDGEKLRGKPEKFADHYTQAKLFYDSQTAVEQAHIEAAFRFELSKLTVPAIRARMLSSLRHVSTKLASGLAAGLGMALPPAMPKVLEQPPTPEFAVSAALSLRALPGDGGVRTRSVALLIADGVEGASLAIVRAALQSAGATVHLIAPRLGAIQPAQGAVIDATGSLENSAPVLFDGLVLPDGAAGIKALGKQMELRDFLASQYRHGKTLLAMGGSTSLLEQAGVSASLANGEPDPGIVIGAASEAKRLAADFIAALGRHRHPEREAGLLFG